MQFFEVRYIPDVLENKYAFMYLSFGEHLITLL